MKQLLYYKEVQARFSKVLENDIRQQREALAVLGSEAEESVRRAAIAVAECRAEAETLKTSILQEAELEVQRLEQERIRNLEAHHQAIRRIEEEIERDRLQTDQRLKEIDEEAQAIQQHEEEEVRRLVAERSEKTRNLRQHAEEVVEAAEQRSRLALEAERRAKAAAREAIMDADKQRSVKVLEAERCCEVWIAAFETVLVDTQRGLAEYLDKISTELRYVRDHLEENRRRADVHWQLELKQIRQEAFSECLEAAAGLEEARKILKKVDFATRANALDVIKECKAVEHGQVQALRTIANELDAARRALGLKARDMPALVQSLKEISLRFRTGRFETPPPKLKHLLGNSAATTAVKPEALTIDKILT